MQDAYRYTTLPLDTPDDDPRWRELTEMFYLGFLDPPVPDDAMPIVIDTWRKMHSRLAVITTDTALGPDRIVGGCTSALTSYNEGAGLTNILIFTEIGVDPAHRRRGLLRRMMAEDLDRAHADGVPFSTLTASEATIYGRWGFAPVTRLQDITIDTRRFAFREGVPVAPGEFAWVLPSYLREHFDRIHDLAHESTLGSMRPTYTELLIRTGEFDLTSGPDKQLRALVHFDEAGQPDGFATYKQPGWDDPIRLLVGTVVGSSPAVEFALWQALASRDLIVQLRYRLYSGDPMPHAIVDPRAIDVTHERDHKWLRILHLPNAVAARSFETDGELTLTVRDQKGYVDGTWRITVRDGRGSAERVDAEPEVTIDVDALAQVWEGTVSPALLAAAGRASGDLAALDRLFHRMTPVRNPAVC